MSYEVVIYKKIGGVAHLTINRPSWLNAINRKVIAKANAAIDLIESDGDLASRIDQPNQLIILNHIIRRSSAREDYTLPLTAACINNRQLS